ncbi:hypothetical protein F5B19DRAFT_273388 [Rostrohypoxylon terebratum]|nr:hypothetical protein F5B19DRAFT_273388 [Rostrohypoxylon terebratum]
MTTNTQDGRPYFLHGSWNGRESRPEPTTKIRGDPWQSVSALQLGLQPRSFAELHTERLFLLQMLQQYDSRALDVFMRVPLVEEKICQVTDPEEQKRARKHRGWLRHRIMDIVEEEKKILARLSELYVEIQCRERWSRVEKEREGMNIRRQYCSDYAGFSMPSQSPWDAQAYQLPSESPTHNYYTQYTGAPGIYSERPTPTQDIYPDYDWSYHFPIYEQNMEDNIGLEVHELDGMAVNDTFDIESRRERQSSGVVPEPKLTKRSSMPSLNRTWSE